MKVTPEVINGVLLHHWFNLVEIPACIQEKTNVRSIKRKNIVIINTPTSHACCVIGRKISLEKSPRILSYQHSLGYRKKIAALNRSSPAHEREEFPEQKQQQRPPRSAVERRHENA
jgi:hypothetical protein